MQELTMILFVACIAVGAVVMTVRRISSGAYMLSTLMSVCALGAVLTDEAVTTSEGFDLTLMVVVPFVIFVWSLWLMLFGSKEAKRWRCAAPPPT